MTVIKKIIYLILPAVLVALLAVSCVEHNGETAEYPLKTFSAEGIVSDSSTGEPLGGINITLRSYEADDLSKECPVFSITTKTSTDGSYFILKVDESEPSLEDFYYEFEVSDSKGLYKTIKRDLYLTRTSLYYTVRSKTYKVENNDFSLELNK